ncbi:RimJ/RimL family protein N-acetyltransferase [Virgibacillus halotolerans]|uniref:GNAT family N-acetyltransferase n=1 Tax=Virgibacillus halotolerans TaxID=1071053 RepID=UPI0019601AF2|nr:RimJ/RimL family protein N-acetyltransferase [Virgibacillus halotolerans]
MIIREIMASDAEKFAKLTPQVEASSEYMLWEAGERNVQVEQQLKMIKRIEQKENSTILVAEKDNNKLVGFLMAVGGNAKRNKHSAYIVIGILKDYRGKGIGTNLFEGLEQWAFNHNIHRLELTVVTRNKAGLSLYKKMGFEIEGTKRHSLFIDGEFVDEYDMSKLL